MTQPAPFHATLPRDPAAIPDLADDIADYCAAAGVTAAEVHAVNLALDELLTNVIDYGLDGVETPQISVALAVEPDRLVAEVTDNGAAFDPFSEVAEPDLDAALADRPIGGLGVHLVVTLMDEVRYAHEDNLNRITLIKMRGRASPPSPR